MPELVTVSANPQIALPASHPFMVEWTAYVNNLGEMHRVIADERIEACKAEISKMQFTAAFKRSILAQLDHLKGFHDCDCTSWDTIEDISSIFMWTVK